MNEECSVKTLSIVVNVSQIVNKEAIFVNELKQTGAKSKTFHKLNN